MDNSLEPMIELVLHIISHSFLALAIFCLFLAFYYLIKAVVALVKYEALCISSSDDDKKNNS